MSLPNGMRMPAVMLPNIPCGAGWYGDIEMYRDSYLSSLLILNGQLFPMVGDEFIVPDNLKTAYDGIISKYADDELGKTAC